MGLRLLAAVEIGRVHDAQLDARHALEAEGPVEGALAARPGDAHEDARVAAEVEVEQLGGAHAELEAGPQAHAQAHDVEDVRDAVGDVPEQRVTDAVALSSAPATPKGPVAQKAAAQR